MKKISLYAILNSLLNIIFPARCSICRQLSAQDFCLTCRQKIFFVKKYITINEVRYFGIAVYDGVLKKALWRIKFNGRRALLPYLQKLVADNLPDEFGAADLLLPVPLHPRRQRERGFNQAELLLAQLPATLSQRLRTDLIVRQRDTKPLFALAEKERALQIMEAFRLLEPQAVRDKTVLIFDDIITSGATVKAIAALLKKAGAKQVFYYSLAAAVQIYNQHSSKLIDAESGDFMT